MADGMRIKWCWSGRVRQEGMMVDGVARLCPKWMRVQSSLTCIATDRVELSQNSSRHVRACPPMTSLRPLEICRSRDGSNDIRDKYIFQMSYAVSGGEGELGELGKEGCSPYFAS